MNTVGIVLLTVVGILILTDIDVATNEDYTPGGFATVAAVLAVLGTYFITKG